jgi:hypothetical protein
MRPISVVGFSLFNASKRAAEAAGLYFQIYGLKPAPGYMLFRYSDRSWVCEEMPSFR